MSAGEDRMADKRCRLRDLGVTIGFFTPGPLNAITDVPGVTVGHTTVIRDHPAVVRTGATAVFPRPNLHLDPVFAGFHRLNGLGEMTGLQVIEELGLLSTPILMTNTHQVGLAHDSLSAYGDRFEGGYGYKLGVVAETYDGWLSDSNSGPLTQADFFAALESARSGPVPEGNVGGGTGMTSYDFKGGIGTASRVVRLDGSRYTVGALVQANHGERHTLRVDGAPVGVEIPLTEVPGTPGASDNVMMGRDGSGPGGQSDSGSQPSSSILVVLATDAPLLPGQCRRLAQRATIGLARTGGVAMHGSGDLFLAFSTGSHYPANARAPIPLTMLPHRLIDPLLEASAEAVEESILNALTAAETLTGYQGRTAHALPLDRLAEALRKYGHATG